MTGQARQHVRDRVADLPDTVRDCEACGAVDSMQIRRSSLLPGPCADDCTLKCLSCYRTRTHGIPVARETLETELEWRDGRTLDFVDDGPNATVEANLAALGYKEY